MSSTKRRVVAGLIAASLSVATGASAAGWRDGIEVLKIGVLAGGDASYRAAVLEPFRAYLQERIGLPVAIVPVGSYAALIDAQTGARSPPPAPPAPRRPRGGGPRPGGGGGAARGAAGGALGFHSILVALSDGPIRALSDARDRRLALAGEDSIAGRLIPMKELADAGIDPEAYFSQIVDASNPEAAIRGLLLGESDLAAGWSSLTGNYATGFDFGVLTKMVADGTLTMDRIRIVWQSRLVPFGPHVVRGDLPPELKSLLAAALRDIGTADPDALDAVDRLGFGGGGFAVPDQSLYAAARELVAPGQSAR